MIRLFNVYYPVRTLVLLAGEALIVWTSFLLGTVLRHPEDAYILLNYQNGYYKISIVTVLVLAFSHLFVHYSHARCAALTADQIGVMKELLDASTPITINNHPNGYGCGCVLELAVFNNNRAAIELLQQYTANWSEAVKTDLLAKYTVCDHCKMRC